MNMLQILKRFSVFLCLCVFLFAGILSPARAYESTTLYNGSRGEEVRELQQALIDLGYLKGTADGVFGNNTENAVRKFQKKNKLTVDGLAGTSTRELILGKAAAKKNSPAATPPPLSSASVQSASSSSGSKSTVSSEPSSSGSLFGSDYSAISLGSRGSRVKVLQQALISAGYLKGKADGIFGSKTFAAVKSFQRSNGLTVDGVAGRRTLSALENTKGTAASSSVASSTPEPSSAPAQEQSSEPTKNSEPEDLNAKIDAPSVGLIQLLHWFNDIKPSLSSGQHLLIYDPSSGLSWTLRILSRGRHCDAEPLTEKDTRTMVSAFGGVNTWNQKPVYVLLPGGTWTVGSTHDMPHDSGTIKNNGFNGHLCVHFLRDMDEAKKNDPKYGVANQETIRAFWKKLTGQDITD